MAKYKGGKKSGKEGDVIHSSWHGREYTRRMPKSVANPQTEAQQAHRNAFSEISRLSSAMKAGHTIGLRYLAARNKLNTHSMFRRLNKNCFNANGIDYPRICIARGPVEHVYITSAEINVQGRVHVTFQSNFTTKNQTDEFYLFVFCPDQRDGICVEPVLRTFGVVDACIPKEWVGHSLHLYAFMRRGRSGCASNTVYVGHFNTETLTEE